MKNLWKQPKTWSEEASLPSFGQGLRFMYNFLQTRQIPTRRFYITKDYDEYEDMVLKVASTGLYAEIGSEPWGIQSSDSPEEELKKYFRSSEAIAGTFPYFVYLSNKKWPMKKVL